MKYLLILTLCVGIAVCDSAGYRNRDFIDCDLAAPGTPDRTFYPYASPTPLGYKTETVTHIIAEKPISCITAIDQKKGHILYGASVRVLEGGRDKNFVALKITSDLGKGFDYKVVIYKGA